MKKAVKTAAVISALLIAVSSFSACDISEKDAAVTSVSDVEAPVISDSGNDNDTDEHSDFSEDTTEEESISEEASEEESTSEKIEADSIDTILNLIKTYPVGTAGSTAKCVDVAIRLINFTQYGDDDAENTIEKFRQNMSEDEKLNFSEGLAEIDYTARQLIDGSTDSIRQYLEDSQETYRKGEYSLEKYEAVYELLSAEDVQDIPDEAM